MSNVVSMTVPESVINSVVKEEISLKIIEALKGNDALVRQIVNTTMMTKVDSDGRPYGRNDYGRDNAPSYLEWLCAKTIREAAQKAMVEYVASSEDQIRSAIEAEMKASSSALARGVVRSLTEAAENRYSLKIEVVTPGR